MPFVSSIFSTDFPWNEKKKFCFVFIGFYDGITANKALRPLKNSQDPPAKKEEGKKNPINKTERGCNENQIQGCAPFTWK